MTLGGKGQLPGGQTAKARTGYRVQSLQQRTCRHASHQIKHNPNHAQHQCLSRCGQLWLLPIFFS